MAFGIGRRVQASQFRQHIPDPQIRPPILSEMMDKITIKVGSPDWLTSFPEIKSVKLKECYRQSIFTYLNKEMASLDDGEVIAYWIDKEFWMGISLVKERNEVEFLQNLPRSNVGRYIFSNHSQWINNQHEPYQNVSKLYLVEYNQRPSFQTMISRTKEYKSIFGPYDVHLNNSQHFVSYVMTGEGKSYTDHFVMYDAYQSEVPQEVTSLSSVVKNIPKKTVQYYGDTYENTDNDSYRHDDDDDDDEW